MSCGKFLQADRDRDNVTSLVVVTWAQGYLSGVNTQRYAMTKQDMAIQPDGESIRAYILKHCTDNPLHTVYEAAIHLSSEMK